MITISKAAQTLGIAEEVLRFALEPLLPDTFDSVEEITDDQFEAIAQSLRAKAVGALPEAKTLSVAPTNQLSDLDKEKLVTGVLRSLADFEGTYQLQIEPIIHALAAISARRTIQGFMDVHGSVMQTEMDRYFNALAEDGLQEIHKVASRGTSSDFLSKNGYDVDRSKFAASMKAKAEEARSIVNATIASATNW